MKYGLDKYAHLDSPLHRWDPRLKLVALVSLIFAFSFVQDLRLLPVMFAVSGALYALSKLPLSFLWTRLRYPGFFLVIVVVLLPFLSGQTVILRLGPLALRQEGCRALILIAGRFFSILTVGLVLFGTAPFLTSMKAMRALGLPSILADMALLAYRYLYEIGDDLGRMETATRLRGFQSRRLSRRGMETLASLAGSLLVRSYERSDRVYEAMLLRGYGRAPRVQADFRWRARDAMALGGVLLVAAGFVAVDIVFRGGSL